MGKDVVQLIGGTRLEGDVILSGAKNAALPCIVAACLGEIPSILENVPLKLNDVQQLIELLRKSGANIQIDEQNNRLYCSRGEFQGGEADKELACKVRPSLLLLGLTAALGHEISLAQPGGCQIGDRKYDLHLMGLRKLGAFVEERENEIYVDARSGLAGSSMDFYLPTTTGSENIMIAATTARGKTLIRNANTRPEVIQMGQLLNLMGCKVTMQSRIVEIEGVTKIKGDAHFTIMSGWDEAVTYIIAAGMTGGEIVVHDFNLSHIREDARHLREIGLELFEWKEKVFVSGKKDKNPFDLFTAPYPGINSDMQPLFAGLATTIHGVSTITDLRFTERFKYVEELKQFGADIEAFGNSAIVRGGGNLTAANVAATDLRGGMACVLVGLVSQGTTTVSNVYQIERGYEDFIGKLNSLGAKLARASIE